MGIRNKLTSAPHFTSSTEMKKMTCLSLSQPVYPMSNREQNCIQLAFPAFMITFTLALLSRAKGVCGLHNQCQMTLLCSVTALWWSWKDNNDIIPVPQTRAAPAHHQPLIYFPNKRDKNEQIKRSSRYVAAVVLWNVAFWYVSLCFIVTVILNASRIKLMLPFESVQHGFCYAFRVAF